MSSDCSDCRQSRVDWWWPVPNPIDGSMTISDVPSLAASPDAAIASTATSHGGATTKRPTRTAPRSLLHLDGPAFVLDHTGAASSHSAQYTARSRQAWSRLATSSK